MAATTPKADENSSSHDNWVGRVSGYCHDRVSHFCIFLWVDAWPSTLPVLGLSMIFVGVRLHLKLLRLSFWSQSSYFCSPVVHVPISNSRSQWSTDFIIASQRVQPNHFSNMAFGCISLVGSDETLTSDLARYLFLHHTQISFATLELGTWCNEFDRWPC